MPPKEQTKNTVERRNLFRPLGEGRSAIFALLETGALVAMLVTEQNGKAHKPRQWEVVLKEGSISPEDDIEIVPLNNGFADVYATTPEGSIHYCRVGHFQGKWVGQEEWTKIMDFQYSKRHQMLPEDAGKPRESKDHPELPLVGGKPEAKEEKAPEASDDADADPDPDAVRREAMRKRGAILDNHTTANKR